MISLEKERTTGSALNTNKSVLNGSGLACRVKVLQGHCAEN